MYNPPDRVRTANPFAVRFFSSISHGSCGQRHLVSTRSDGDVTVHRNQHGWVQRKMCRMSWDKVNVWPLRRLLCASKTCRSKIERVSISKWPTRNSTSSLSIWCRRSRARPTASSDHRLMQMSCCCCLPFLVICLLPLRETVDSFLLFKRKEEEKESLFFYFCAPLLFGCLVFGNGRVRVTRSEPMSKTGERLVSSLITHPSAS